MIYLNEYKQEIIELFEEFLESRGIDIPNDEKDEDDWASTIYGSDYDELMDGLSWILGNLVTTCRDNYDVVVDDVWPGGAEF